MLEPRSPLAGVLRPGQFGKPGAAGVRLSLLPNVDCMAIAARAGQVAKLTAMALPAGPGAIFRGADTLVWTAPGQWLAFREGTGLAQALTAIPPAVASLTALGGARSVFEVQGPAARQALGTLLALDLHPRVFGPGSAASSIAAHVGVLLWQVDEAPRYRLACYRSFAGALWHALLHAAEPHGCTVTDGPAPA